MRLYLIRHAQSTANVEGKLNTLPPGPGLTDLGHSQAEALAERLSGEPIVAVYASPAVRAQQTAAPLATTLDLEVQVIEGVQEVYVGDLEDRTDREAVRTYLDTVGPWTRGELGVAMPGGETGHQVRARYLGAVGELRAKHAERDHDDLVVALVSHGGAIRLGAEWLTDNVTAEIADRDMLPNTSVVELESRPGGTWRCLRWAGLEL
ncbi:histidine phosphatase family protein [Amycolatopsis cihanbeyliensis]|uniref:Putative phosphoglycerate mutase n=1 Tax=Amycolatopsis cihanbeyliensis TaxID=1128664 RepID=A0A542DM05_AMYCI|nr:histidine phosphatase family protein [Amycolatopsis cihanbeyliensis]TQJ04122.1 putative phosphoglycerate mutase [Amycolatopsis cihanbeyliensis]